MEKIAYTTGTFDLPHEGHFRFLKTITQYGYNKIIIGLVTDEFAIQRKRKCILSYDHRRSILENSKYNVIVVPCVVSDKIHDYKKIKFDALFIEDGYYQTDEYDDFHREYEHIPIHYIPRVLNESSTSKIINDMNFTIFDTFKYSHDTDNADNMNLIFNDYVIKILNKNSDIIDKHNKLKYNFWYKNILLDKIDYYWLIIYNPEKYLTYDQYIKKYPLREKYICNHILNINKELIRITSNEEIFIYTSF